MDNLKRNYSKPELIMHGNIKDITKGTGEEACEDYGWGCES